MIPKRRDYLARFLCGMIMKYVASPEYYTIVKNKLEGEA